MGYLLPILLALGSLALDDFDLGGEASWPLVIPLLAIVPHALAAIEKRAAMGGKFRFASGCSRLRRSAPVMLQYIAVGALGWRRWLEVELDIYLSPFEWPDLTLLLALAPFFVFAFLAIDAEARLNSRTRSTRSHMRRFQLRMFAAATLPIAAYLAIAALFGAHEELRVGIEEVALWGILFTAGLLLLFIYGLPIFLRHTWDTEELDQGPQFELLQRVANLASFRCRSLLVWRTGGLVANAAIVGLTPGSRRVFFTDALLRRLGPRELAAVFAHEIGHAKRHHVPTFLIWALGYFTSLDLLVTYIDPEEEWLGLGILLAALGIWGLGFGWLSRRAELEADLYCHQLLRDGVGITSALQSVTAGRHDRSGWRHFSTNKRIEFLGRASVDPEVGRRLCRRLRILKFAGLALLIGAGALQITRLVQRYPEDRVRVELRLGRYESAALRLATVERPEDDLAQLVNRVSTSLKVNYDTRHEAGQACLEQARRALVAADGEATYAWLELASATGDRTAGRAAAAMRGLALDEDSSAEPETPPGTWRDEIEAILNR